MEKKKNIWVGKIVVIVLIIVSIGSYYVFPSVKHVMNQVFKMFASGDFAVVRDFVASYGAYAALISFLLMIFQSIAAPLPAFLITFANANLFGWWQGAILSWSSAMAGAAVGIVIELKYSSEEKDLELDCREALNQIKNKNYTQELRNRGFNKIIKYGISFCRKKCRVMTIQE